jgi:hypothetical protein
LSAIVLTLATQTLVACHTPGLAGTDANSTVGSADATDRAAINQAVTDFYQAISAPAGGALDRPKLTSLFVSGGRIAIVRPAEGTRAAEVAFRTVNGYADGSDRFTASSGFFDHVIHNRVEQFGLIAHVYSAYESSANPDGKRPLARGVKSFELFRSAGKWLIVQVYFDTERPGNPIPREYLAWDRPSR